VSKGWAGPAQSNLDPSSCPRVNNQVTRINTKMDIRDMSTARKVKKRVIKGSKTVTKGMTTIKTSKDADTRVGTDNECPTGRIGTYV